MKLIAVMIASLFLITASWAQGDQTKDGRKSKPMNTAKDSKTAAP